MVVKRSRAGQSTVEYMLYVAVIVVALLMAAYVLFGPFLAGYQELGADMKTVFEEGQGHGENDRR